MMKVQVEAPPLWLEHTTLLWCVHSPEAKVCIQAAERSGSMLTKRCLFPMACTAPRVSSAPEGRQTKRRHCFTPKSLCDTFAFSSQRGYVFLWGVEWQKERFLETGPRGNKTTVVLSYVYVFSLNALLSWGIPPPPHPLVLLRLWAFCPVFVPVSTHSEWNLRKLPAATGR